MTYMLITGQGFSSFYVNFFTFLMIFQSSTVSSAQKFDKNEEEHCTEITR